MSIIKDKKIKQITIDGTVIPLYNLDHTVRFVVNDEDYQIVGVKDGNKISKPVNPTISVTHTFIGWSTSNLQSDIISFPYTPTTSINLNAIITDFTNYYQQVEYLQSTGEQYIDLEFEPTMQDVIDLKVKCLREGFIFGARISNTTSAWGANFDANSSNPLNIRAGGQILQTTTFTIDNDYTIHMENGNTYINDGQHSTTTYYNSIPTDKNYYLFTVNDNGQMGSSGYSVNRFYYFKINNSVQNLDLIPVYRKIDNKPGMYDKKSGTFYTNANISATTDFVVGPDVN